MSEPTEHGPEQHRLLDLSEIRAFIRKLPATKIHYPHGFMDKGKFFFWKLYRPFHPFLRDAGTTLRILRHSVERQEFLMGTIDLSRDFEPLMRHLLSLGFGNQAVAWKDSGEVASVRLSDGFKHQYHVRVFEDGEVRGHYEHTPEAHPVRHMLEIGMEPRRAEFMQMIGGRIRWSDMEETP